MSTPQIASASPTTTASNHSRTWSLRALVAVALVLVVLVTLRSIARDEQTLGEMTASSSWSSPPACLTDRGYHGHWHSTRNDGEYVWKDDECPVQSRITKQVLCNVFAKLDITRLVVVGDGVHDATSKYMERLSHQLRTYFEMPVDRDASPKIDIACPDHDHSIIYQYLSIDIDGDATASNTPIVKQINQRSGKLLLGNPHHSTAVLWQLGMEINDTPSFQRRFLTMVQAMEGRMRESDYYFYLNAVPPQDGSSSSSTTSTECDSNGHPIDTFDEYMQEEQQKDETTTRSWLELPTTLNAWTYEQTKQHAQLYTTNVYNATVLRGRNVCQTSIANAWIQLWVSQLLDIIYHGRQHHTTEPQAIPGNHR